jgi:hypothetical protein
MKKILLCLSLILISFSALNAVDQFCTVNGCHVYLYEDANDWTLTIFCDSGERSITSGIGEYGGTICFGEATQI